MARDIKTDQIERLLQIQDLGSLSAELTALMSGREHHTAIESLGPEKLANRISTLSTQNALSKMKGAAELSRLATTLPKHAKEFIEHLSRLIDARPLDLDKLDSPNEKFYFASALAEIEADWITDYCVEQALREDQAERVRKRLLKRALVTVEGLDQLMNLIANAVKDMQTDEGRRTPGYRVRKAIETVSEIANESDLVVGRTAPESVRNLLKAYLRVAPDDRDDTPQAFDSALSTLIRVIQTRMSLLLSPEAFSVIPLMKTACRSQQWREFLSDSKKMKQARSMLLDAVTILAGQEKTDREFVRLLEMCFKSSAYLQDQLVDQLSGGDIDPDTRDWWIKLGKVKSKATSEQHTDITVDQQLALLMLRVDAMHEPIGKLRSDVAPILHISDPILSPVISAAASQYEGVARTVRQLCRIRKLEFIGIAGTRVEFSPKVHEFVGGDVKGERKVRVVRDGVQKNYGGSKRLILKAQVEPIS